MPSGAKRRKAAKKKKEKDANINASTNDNQGNDELKFQDEKGSDGDEASSPACHDHDNHHHPFNEGDEEVEERDPSDVQPSLDVKSMEEVTGDIKSGEMIGGDDDGVVSMEKELKSEESSDSKNISVEHIDTASHHPFNEGDEEVEEGYGSVTRPSLDVKSMKEVTSDIKSGEMIGKDDDGFVSTEKELKSDESSDGKNVSVQHIDTANHHPFNEGEKVEERDPSDAQPSLDVKSMEEVTSDIKSGEMVGGDDDGVVSIEQELKSKESSDSKIVSVEHIDTANHLPFNEGDEEVEERDPSDSQPSLDVKSMEEVTGDIKSGEMVGGDDDGVVSIEQELKSEESSDSKNVSIEHIDTVNHHPFNEGDGEVEERDPSDAQPSLDIKSMEEVIGDIKSGEMVGGDDSGVSIEQELKSKESSDNKNVSVEHIDTANHHPFNEGDEEVEERDPSDAQPSLDVKSMEEFTGDIKSGEMVVGDDDGVVSIEQELKSEESSNSKNESVKLIDTVNQHPFNEGDEEVEERNPSSLDVKSIEEVTSDIKSVEMVGGDDDGIVSIEQELKSEESFDRKNVSAEHIDTANGSYYGDRNSNCTSYNKSITEKNLEEPPFDANQEAITSDNLVKFVNSSLSKTTMITENAPAKEIDASVDSSFIVNSVMAVTSVSEVKRSDAESALIEKSAAPAAAATNLAMKKNEDIVYPLSAENVRTSRLEEHKPKECDSEVPESLSSSPLIAKDSETRECSVNQPLVASAPPMVQKTSWLSCCGLLEMLFGSK